VAHLGGYEAIAEGRSAPALILDLFAATSLMSDHLPRLRLDYKVATHPFFALDIRAAGRSEWRNPHEHC
jgi:hypothetical protein